MFHWMLHAHDSVSRDGVGVITLCTHRFRGDLCSAWFRPDYPGAGWHYIPDGVVGDIVGAGSAMEAMSIVRRNHEPS